MPNPKKSKRFYLIDKFSDTSRYHFIIDNPEFEKHVPDLYPTELQLIKVSPSDIEPFFLDLNTCIKVIGNNIHTSTCNKCDNFGFPIVNFPWLSGDVSRLQSVFTFSSWTDVLDVVLTFVIFILKSSNHFKLLIQGYGKRFRSSSGDALNFCPYLVEYRFKNMFQKESLTRSSQ